MSKIFAKVVFVGDSMVGKTSIIQKLTTNAHISNLQTTTASSYVYKDVDYDGQKLQLQLWDTAGQERFRALSMLYYQKTNVFAVVFDVTQYSSFSSLDYWLDTIKQEEPAAIPIILANKIDILNRMISQQQVEDYAKRKNVLFCSCSALSGENIQLVLEYIAQIASGNKSIKPRQNIIVVEEIQKDKCC